MNTTSMLRFRRFRVLALLLAVLMLAAAGCRAMLAGAIVGAAVGYAVVTAHRAPPPRYHVHTSQYYYDDGWHSHPPRSYTVEYYYHGGSWYRCRDYRPAPTRRHTHSSSPGHSRHYYEERHYHDSGYGHSRTTRYSESSH